MDIKHEHNNQRENGFSEKGEQEPFDSEEYVAPGAPIVRKSTPKPLSVGLSDANISQPQTAQALEYDGKSVFPVEAPSAPPLPEECEESESATATTALHIVEATPLPLTSQAVSSEKDEKSKKGEEPSTEFLWLFEYGRQMDTAILNSSAQLDGLALLYGPAVLKGYEITCTGMNSSLGESVVTIVPSRKRGAEVWGVLYRIPRRLIRQIDTGPALLDKVHSAAPSDNLFERCHVVVHESYRGREVNAITYVASAVTGNQSDLLQHGRRMPDSSDMQDLLEIARKQKLPEDYLHHLAELAALSAPGKDGRDVPLVATLSTPAREQNTEPLPVLTEEVRPLTPLNPVQETPSPSHPHQSVAMTLFAIYLVLLLGIALTLAILQGSGIGAHLFPVPERVTSLAIPWFVLIFGLLGGCLSCIIRLGRREAVRPPNFVLITWFARPCVGAILAVLMYFLLKSGLFAFGGSAGQQSMLFAVIAMLAGACEGWLFYKRT